MADFYEDEKLTLKQFLVALAIGYVLDVIPELLEVSAQAPQHRHSAMHLLCTLPGATQDGPFFLCEPLEERFKTQWTRFFLLGHEGLLQYFEISIFANALEIKKKLEYGACVILIEQSSIIAIGF